MDLQDFVDNVPNLTDLELAVLLSLIANEHCLVHSDDDLLEPLASELALIVSETFKLSHVILEAKDLRSLEAFGDAILDENHNFADESDFGSEGASPTGLNSRLQNVSFRGARSSIAEQALDSRMVVNVIIAKDFNYACHDVANSGHRPYPTAKDLQSDDSAPCTEDLLIPSAGIEFLETHQVEPPPCRLAPLLLLHH